MIRSDAANTPVRCIPVNGSAISKLGTTEAGELSPGFRLNPSFPNPVNRSATIHYYLPKPSDIRLIVYNLAGREIVRLVDQRMGAGRHEVVWNNKDAHGRDVSSGLYIARMTGSRNVVKSIKLVLVK